MSQSKKSEDVIAAEMIIATIDNTTALPYERFKDCLRRVFKYGITHERSKYAEILKEAEELLIGVSTQKSIPLVRFHKWLESVNKLQKDKV